MTRYKRPFALQSGGIGVWESWLFFLAYVGVAINAFILSFTSNYFECRYLSQYDGTSGRWVARLTFMLVFEHAVLAVQLIVTSFLPAIPKKVAVTLKRQDYIEKLMRGEVEDESQEHIQFNLKSVRCE